MSRIVLLLLGVSLTACWTSRSRADDVRVTADTALQIYEVRSPGAGAFLARRRLMQTLGLGWHREVTGGGAAAPVRLSASVLLRLDQEFGEDCLISRDLCYLATRPGDPGFYQPLAEDTEVDAPEAWVGVRNLPVGLAGRAGRQLLLGSLGMLRIDGANVSITPDTWARVESAGGIVVRDTSLAGSDAFIPQGSLRRDLELPEDRPLFIDPGVTSWVVAVALEVGHPDWVRARVEMRELREADDLVLRQLGVSAWSQPLPALRLRGSAGWELHGRLLSDLEAEAEVTLAKPLVVRLRAERHVPLFDWGTIWAYFQRVPVDESSIDGTFTVHRHLELGVGGRMRRAELEEGRDEYDAGVEGHVTTRLMGVRLELSGFAWGGDLGPVAAVLLRASRTITTGASVELRTSAWHVNDPFGGGFSGTSLSEVAALQLQMSQQTRLWMELSHAHSSAVGHRYRAIASVQVEVWR